MGLYLIGEELLIYDLEKSCMVAPLFLLFNNKKIQ